MKGLWLCKGMAIGWAVCGILIDMNPGVGEFAAQIMACIQAQKPRPGPWLLGKG